MTETFELLAPEIKADFRSIAGPHSGKVRTDTWLTPLWLLELLGLFDLDPCAAPLPRPWPTAVTMYQKPEDDGLALPWHGRVWLNPPYGNKSAIWLERLAEHGNGIALVFARTDTEMFARHVFDRAQGILFIAGRLTFCDARGRTAAFNAGGPSCLVAYGSDNLEALRKSRVPGKVISL